LPYERLEKSVRNVKLKTGKSFFCSEEGLKKKVKNVSFETGKVKIPKKLEPFEKSKNDFRRSWGFLKI